MLSVLALNVRTGRPTIAVYIGNFIMYFAFLVRFPAPKPDSTLVNVAHCNPRWHPPTADGKGSMECNRVLDWVFHYPE